MTNKQKKNLALWRKYTKLTCQLLCRFDATTLNLPNLKIKWRLEMSTLHHGAVSEYFCVIVPQSISLLPVLSVRKNDGANFLLNTFAGALKSIPPSESILVSMFRFLQSPYGLSCHKSNARISEYNSSALQGEMSFIRFLVSRYNRVSVGVVFNTPLILSPAPPFLGYSSCPQMATRHLNRMYGSNHCGDGS